MRMEKTYNSRRKLEGQRYLKAYMYVCICAHYVLIVLMIKCGMSNIRNGINLSINNAEETGKLLEKIWYLFQLPMSVISSLKYYQ